MIPVFFVVTALATSPTQLLHDSAREFQTRNWSALWQTYSPTYRAVCPYQHWLRGMRRLRNSFPGSPPRLRILHIQLRGPHTALATYNWTYRNHVQHVVNDVLVEIRGRWYDELDQNTTCL